MLDTDRASEKIGPVALPLNSRCPQWPVTSEAFLCSCYHFEDGLFLECPETGLDAIRKSLETISSPIKLFTIYHLDANVTALPGHVFANSSIEKLYISHSNLTNLTATALSGLEASLKVLTISNGHLRTVPQSSLSMLKSLESLDLDSNEISHVDSYAFYGQPLVSLNLQGNLIVSLLEYSFGGLENTLEELGLINNRLDAFPLAALRRLRKLRNLKLVGNEISEIPDDGYTRLTALTNLDLRTNRIRHLDDRSFITMPKLVSLCLASNKLTTIDDKVFVHLTDLETLDMSRNAVRVLNGAVFASLVKLRSLDLSRNHLHLLEVGTFHNLPNLKELFMSRNNLFRLNNGTFYNTTQITALFLEHNAINQIESGFFHNLPHLHQLHLSFNTLAAIHGNLFKHSSELHSLSLDNNVISDLSPGTFQELVELRDLRLQRNRIRIVNKQVFYSLPSLQELHLQSNAIESIEDDSFQSLVSLQHLNLQFNSMLEMSNVLSNYPSSLRYMQLSNNNLRVVRRDCLKGQAQIEILWLDHNKIKKLHRTVLSDLVLVEKVYLNDNELTNIEVGTFEGLKNLNYLNIEHNQLSHLSANAFRGLENLETLLLNHNLITAIEPNSFQGLVQLRKLDISHNAIYIIRKFMFDNLDKLEELRMSDCRIEELEERGSSVLRKLRSLRTLDLSDNKVTAAAIDFSSMSQVTYLHLAGNDFSGSLSADIFHGLSVEYMDMSATRFNLTANRQVLRPIWPTVQVLKLNDNQITLPLLSDPGSASLNSDDQFGHLSAVNTVKELSLDNNELTDVPSEDVLSKLSLLESLSIQGNNIKWISRGAFEANVRLRTLNLSNNSLSVLNAGAFVTLNESLRTLNLSNNVIRSVGPQVFDGLNGLEVLVLDNNWFQYIPNSLILSHLPKLRVLSVRRNPLNRVGEEESSAMIDPGSRFMALEQLSLTEGNLTVIGSRDFVHYPSLLSLSLGNNRISKISPSSFRPLGRLSALDLSANEIELLPEERLSGLKLLVELNLSRNHLLEMPSFSPDLIRLRQLDLSHNRLTRVDSFGHLGETMQLIVLANNMIGWIAANAFQNLTSLETLDMSNNFITHLQDSLFTPVEVSLETILLSGNPLHCDCRLLSLWQWLQDHTRYLIGHDRDSSGLLCIQPDKLKETAILSLNPVDFCPVPLIWFLEVATIDSTIISLHWDVHNGSLVGGFTLDYVPNSGPSPMAAGLSGQASGSFNQVVALGAERRTVQIDALVPETVYTICVQANGRYAKMAPTGKQTPYVVGHQRTHGEYSTSNRKCLQARTLAFNEKRQISLPTLGIIIGSAITVLLFISLLILLAAMRWRKKRRRPVKNDVPEEYITYRHFSLPFNENVYS
ncbi:Insulin-like growth factor-binding protein complex acid labile subunit [Halotydeus destructor]|nr:Insulin-like growth factor-binding protein complex acid labile subunit [Halotydeus destructor]